MATLLQPGTSAPPVVQRDPFAGMTLLTAEGQQSRAKQAIEITRNALKRIRIAMAKEGISPSAGGLRVGITGGGCSGLSYNIRFDTQPRERDRTFVFGSGLETPNDPSGAARPWAHAGEVRWRNQVWPDGGLHADNDDPPPRKRRRFETRCRGNYAFEWER